MFQKTWEFDQELHALFVDFKKAYDCIIRESIYKILEQFHLPQKLIGLNNASLKKTIVKVKVGNVLSREVQVNTGLRQGDALSPIIFNLVLEK